MLSLMGCSARNPKPVRMVIVTELKPMMIGNWVFEPPRTSLERGLIAALSCWKPVFMFERRSERSLPWFSARSDRRA